jgi:hypothetical protein
MIATVADPESGTCATFAPDWPPDYSAWTGCDGCHTVWRMFQERFCHCDACHRSFASDRAFDAHRRGPFEPVGLRACADPDPRVFEFRDGAWHRRGSPPDLRRAD